MRLRDTSNEVVLITTRNMRDTSNEVVLITTQKMRH